jgi:hypothetical protein
MIEFQEGHHAYYVYILTNKEKTVLYTVLQIIKK